MEQTSLNLKWSLELTGLNFLVVCIAEVLLFSGLWSKIVLIYYRSDGDEPLLSGSGVVSKEIMDENLLEAWKDVLKKWHANLTQKPKQVTQITDKQGHAHSQNLYKSCSNILKIFTRLALTF